MKVFPVIPRGYCKGVVAAISLAKKQATTSHPVHILGMIVHNQFIVDALEKQGIKTIEKKGLSRIELLDYVDSGTVIITAHGASDEVFKKARKKGLHVVDATCQDVIKTYTLIKDALNDGFEILYIGKLGHPEAEGALSINPEKIHLIENAKQIDNLSPNQKYIITNQTTMSLYDVYDICEYAKEKLVNITIAKEVCNATQIRQVAINDLPSDIDVTFIVGDPHSNNTKKLSQIAVTSTNNDVYMIESVKDITIDMLTNKTYAAVSSGASTPTSLTNQVINYIEQFDENKPQTHPLPDIDYERII